MSFSPDQLLIRIWLRRLWQRLTVLHPSKRNVSRLLLGADTWNQTKECDSLPIHAILTDGVNYEFYILNFNEWSVYRGVGTAEEGMAWNMDHRLTLSLSERSPDYLARLKTGAIQPC